MRSEHPAPWQEVPVLLTQGQASAGRTTTLQRARLSDDCSRWMGPPLAEQDASLAGVWCQPCLCLSVVCVAHWPPPCAWSPALSLRVEEVLDQEIHPDLGGPLPHSIFRACKGAGLWSCLCPALRLLLSHWAHRQRLRSRYSSQGTCLALIEHLPATV